MILLENMYYEDAAEAIELERYRGNVALSNTKKNPLSVAIANENGTYYMAASDLEQYMEANHMIDATSALKQITEANKVPMDNLIVVVDEAFAFTLETLSESGVMLERAAEADSTSLKQAMRWYKKFLRKSRVMSKDTSKQMLQERINVLKECVRTMEKAKRDAQNGKVGGRIKYALKSLIPFNSLFRLIKKQDVYAGLGLIKSIINTGFVIYTGVTAGKAVAKFSKSYSHDFLDDFEDEFEDDFDDADFEFEDESAVIGESFESDLMDTYTKAQSAAKKTKLIRRVGAAAGGADIGIRLVSYTKMLDAQIERTNEAIKFLEERLSEM